MSERSGGPRRRAGVAGSPIAHSLSPVLHRAAYQALGLSDWDYQRYEVGTGELASFVNGLDAQWAGLSVTMPGKEEALTFASDVTPRALLSGGANTLIRTETGWLADNTDIDGITAALAEVGRQRIHSGWIIGSGATARSAMIALAGMGATSICLQVRARPRPATLTLAQDLGIDVTVVGFDDGGVTDRPSMQGTDVAISTVPAGTAPLHPSQVLGGGALGSLVVMDVAYHPRRSEWATWWVDQGAHMVDGAVMLLHQGAAQVHLMTGHPAPLEPMRRAVLEALASDGHHPR
ncbi:MAG: shikimate dehydrogenase [Ornithinimicrobium sp.]